MRRHWKLAAFLTAALGLVVPAAAQTPGGGGGGTGTASTSPGVGTQGESMTGVGIPAVAPVDNRTLEPVQIGTGRAGQHAPPASGERPGAGSTAYTDLSQSSTSTGSTGTEAGTTGTGASKN